MIKEFYAIKLLEGGYFTGHPSYMAGSVKNPIHAINFKTIEGAHEYIANHQFEINGREIQVVKIRETIEEIPM